MSESTPRILALVSCRICKENYGEFLTLDSVVAETSDHCCNTRLLELFNEVTRLGAQLDDQLPQMVCQQCVQQLQQLSDFLRKAQRTENELRLALLLDEDEQKKAQDTIVSKVADKEDITALAEELVLINDSQTDAPLDSTETLTVNEIIDKFDQDAGDDDTQDSYESYAALDSCRSECSAEEDEAEVESLSSEHTKEQIEITRIVSPTPSPEVSKTTRSQRTRSQHRNFECATCHKRFQTTQKLQQHQLVHTQVKNFVCPVCDKRFATVYRQRDHLKMHTDERNFSCDICDKCFFLRAHLKAHQLTHTGRRPHTCEICGVAFLQSSVLKTHMALHEGKTAECNICQRKFSRPAHLKIHKRIHSGERPYKCTHCDNAYMQKSHLDRHLGTHLGVRFKCEHCTKVYTKKSTLDMHLRQEHLRNHIYTCNICTMDFSKQKSYYYHMKTKHPKNAQTPAEKQSSEQLV